ncbi:MAG: hypothetical protein AAFW69_09715 [Pseudomonadota bacterium]
MSGAEGDGRPRRRRAPVALTLLAACFLASGLVRLGDGALALAETGEMPRIIARDPSQGTDDTAADLARNPPLSPPLAGCVPDPGSDALLAAIREREAQLDTRAAELDDRARLLEVAELRVREQIAALETIEARLAETVQIAETAAEDDLGRLVAVYESMKPKDAAEIFASMDLDFAAGFLARMQSEAAAPILAELDAGQAYAISVIMAGRNAAAPTE